MGVNCAGLLNKLESFEDLLISKEPAIFCLQETKAKRLNQIKTESCKKFTIYELLRKKCNGGGLAIGVQTDLQPAWVDQGDEEVEVLVVEVWVNEFPIRIVNGYGPQLSDSVERKRKYWNFLEKQVNNAIFAGAGLILQMDANCHLGPEIIDGDVNEQNANGKLFCDFLQRNPHLTIINSLSLCDGKITRTRKTTKVTEESILDVFVTCDRILPYITSMKIDEKREHVLTNFKTVKKQGRIIESDHNALFLDLGLKFSRLKNERITVYQFKNKKSQEMFKNLTNNTDEFTNCFDDLKNHMKKHHPDIIKCEVCDITFKDEMTMKAHSQNNHTIDQGIQCLFCDFTSVNKKIVEHHVEKEHTKGRLIKCDVCNITLNASFEEQTIQWRTVLEKYFQKCFKKIRITNKLKGKNQDINCLMEKRREFIRKDILNEDEENELHTLEENIAMKCEEINKKKVMENFGELVNQGDVSHQGIWKIKKKYFPKNEPSLPAGKRNFKQQLITNPGELKELYCKEMSFPPSSQVFK